MIRALALLLSCQLAGEVLTRALALPVPGPVLGLVLLVAGLGLAARLGRVDAERIDGTELGRTASGLLGVLGLLFVPAGVGVVQQGGLLLRHGMALGAALVVSTVAALVVTAWVFVAVSRLIRRP